MMGYSIAMKILQFYSVLVKVLSSMAINGCSSETSNERLPALIYDNAQDIVHAE